jgi:hypothetical protein
VGIHVHQPGRISQEILQQSIFCTIEGAAAMTGYKCSEFRQVSMDERACPDARLIFILAEVPPTSGLLTLALDDEAKADFQIY